MYKFPKLFALGLGLLAGACVIPYEINVHGEKTYMVVEATLTDIDANQTINIHETHNLEKNTFNIPTLNLQIEIIINGSEIINCTEKGNGNYVLPFAFRVKPGTSYKLRIKKSDGTVYESSEEKTTPVPTIDKVFDVFEANGIKGEFRDTPANYIYLDFKDNPDEKNYYLWSWQLWERQHYCYSNYYDFNCASKCWEILHNKDFNVFSDVYSNGKANYGRLICKIPLYSLDGALLEIKQQAVSAQVYQYFRLMSQQQQTTGTLVDTPPAAIVGNIKNINNATEPVSGVFSVASTVKQKYWLDRKNALGKAIPIGLLGRSPMIAPNSRPYPCVEGPGRTPGQPEGWVE